MRPLARASKTEKLTPCDAAGFIGAYTSFSNAHEIIFVVTRRAAQETAHRRIIRGSVHCASCVWQAALGT